jgi:hypothetical protein
VRSCSGDGHPGRLDELDELDGLDDMDDSSGAGRMRLAFLTPYDSAYASIFQHTNVRISEWRRLGLDVETFVVGNGGRNQRGPLANLFQDLRTTAELTRGLRTYEPDLICTRWLTPVPGQVARLRRIAPVVFEIHSNDVGEVADGRPLHTLYTKTFRGRELAGGSGACFVTKELEGLQEFRTVPGPRGSFGNGTCLVQRTLTADRTVPAQPPKRIIGMSVGHPHDWSGLDRFSRLADALPQLDWVVVCPQSAMTEVAAAVSRAVVVRGTQSPDEYYDEVRSWTVAIGTMALERKGLSSATPLKVRDYVGLGVPTVLPYWDDDLGTVSDPLLANLADKDQASTPVTPEFLTDFADAAAGKNLLPSTSAAVSVNSIESRRVQLFRSVALDARRQAASR